SFRRFSNHGSTSASRKRRSPSASAVAGSSPGGLFGTIEGARIILGERKAQQHTDGRRKRDRNQEPDKTEQVTENEQCKHHPNRVQIYPTPHKIGREHVVAERLPDKKDSWHQSDPSPTRPELGDRHAGRDEQPGQGAEIRHETDQSRGKADEKAMIEADQDQR